MGASLPCSTGLSLHSISRRRNLGLGFPPFPSVPRCAAFSSALVILEPLLEVGGRLDNTLSNIIAGAVGGGSLDALGACLAFGRGSGVVVVVTFGRDCEVLDVLKFLLCECCTAFEVQLDTGVATYHRWPGRQVGQREWRWQRNAF